CYEREHIDFVDEADHHVGRERGYGAPKAPNLHDILYDGLRRCSRFHLEVKTYTPDARVQLERITGRPIQGDDSNPSTPSCPVIGQQGYDPLSTSRAEVCNDAAELHAVVGPPVELSTTRSAR